MPVEPGKVWCVFGQHYEIPGKFAVRMESDGYASDCKIHTLARNREGDAKRKQDNSLFDFCRIM